MNFGGHAATGALYVRFSFPLALGPSMAPGSGFETSEWESRDRPSDLHDSPELNGQSQIVNTEVRACCLNLRKDSEPPASPGGDTPTVLQGVLSLNIRPINSGT